MLADNDRAKGEDARRGDSARKPVAHGLLYFFPISFFAMVMGLLGFAIALQRAELDLGLFMGASWVVLLFAVVVFVVIAAFYTGKAFLHPHMVAEDWMHPVRIAFFPAISISILLLATALLSPAPGVARVVWLIGAALQLVLTLSVVANWIGRRTFVHATLSPAWFIPAVGNAVAPIAGAWLGYLELSWFFFAAGMIFWIVLLTLVMNRLVFHDPLPARLQPTLVILMAPPALGFTAYVALTGQVDPFARILMNAAYLFALIVVTQLPSLLRVPFALSFWALSFPIAALTVASFRYGALVGSTAHTIIGLGCLFVLMIVIALLLWRTVVAVLREEVFQPD